MKKIYVLAGVALMMTACGNNEKDYDATGTFEATTDTTVFRLMPADLEKILSHDPRLMMNYIKILSNVVSHLTKKVRMLSMSVREKVIHYLEEQIRLQQSKDVLLPFSRQELADHFGIQKYSLQRCLNELKQEGAILVEGRHVKVLSFHPSGGNRWTHLGGL